MKLKASEILAQNIKALRLKKDLKSFELAEMAGVTPNVITAIESGEANPTLKKIESFAEALDTTVSELLKDKK